MRALSCIIIQWHNAAVNLWVESILQQILPHWIPTSYCHALHYNFLPSPASKPSEDLCVPFKKCPWGWPLPGVFPISRRERFYSFLHCWQNVTSRQGSRSRRQWLPSYSWKASIIFLKGMSSLPWCAVADVCGRSTTTACHHGLSYTEQLPQALRAASELSAKKRSSLHSISK